MWKVVVVALLALAGARADASAITVYSDVGRLSASASGCGRLVYLPTAEQRGSIPCTSYATTVESPLLGAGLVQADAGSGVSIWNAHADARGSERSVDLFVLAQLAPFESSNTAPCGTDTCRIEVDAVAQSSIRWDMTFGVSGGDSAFYFSVPSLRDPFTFALMDLTAGGAAETSGARWMLLDGHRYALAFEITNLGTVCSRSCASAFSAAFDPSANVARVPGPGAWRLMLVGLIGVLTMSRPGRGVQLFTAGV